MIKWRAFFICNGLVKPALHFFPHSISTSAPYPVNCTLTIFGQNISSKSITLDGARINQPDGVRLDAVFPELIDSIHGLVGLDIVISSESNRVDLSASQCVIELIQSRGSTKFYAKPITKDQEDLLVEGQLTVPPQEKLSATIIAINGGPQSTDITIDGVSVNSLGNSFLNDSSNQSGRLNKTVTLTPWSVVEIDSAVRVRPVETTAGEQQAKDLNLSHQPASSFQPGVFKSSGKSQDIALYAMFRDPQTNIPFSIQAL